MAMTNANFSAVMKTHFIGPIKTAMRAVDAIWDPDYGKTPEEIAWRDAVRWLEERRAAEREWPWPRRPA